MKLDKLPETVDISNSKTFVNFWMYCWVMLWFGQYEFSTLQNDLQILKFIRQIRKTPLFDD